MSKCVGRSELGIISVVERECSRDWPREVVVESHPKSVAAVKILNYKKRVSKATQSMGWEWEK